jgi:biotin carboxyl carrier protein
MDEPIAAQEKPRARNGSDTSKAAPGTPAPDYETSSETRGVRGIFRPDFLRAYRQRTRAGDVLRVTPPWLEPAYWTLLALTIVGVLYAVLGQVHGYASGPAVIRFEDRAELACPSDAIVSEILAHPGEAVAQGQVLVRLYAGRETAELNKAEREFELALANLLRDPSDQDARESMARLRSERDRRIAEVDERALRSSIEGTVSDVRIRPGQHLDPGDPVMSIVGSSPRPVLIAVLPGNYRPLLHRGLQDLRVSAISDEIVGPAAIRRYLGKDQEDTFELTGPALLAYAELPGSGFEWEGRQREYYDGMLGRVQVSVQKQSILLTLIPGLRSVFGQPR